ncbi:MAG: PhnD/SsuA/transferrin family substrate-binding protein [Cyclobacteriaceae bacterium]|nr:PhnD/SsuA/transferrin family substrate-binding protein [Cyclobacteriaceae bacterium]
MKKILLAALFSLIGFFVACAQQRPLTLATYTYSTNNRLQNLQPLAHLMTQWMGQPVKAVSYPTVKALIQAILADSVDFAMMNTSGYLVLTRQHPGKAEPLVNLAMGGAQQTNYGGCLLIARKTGITSPAELKGKRLRLALVASSSTSGNLVPRLLLNDAGMASAEEHVDVYYAGTHKKVIDDLMAGQADAGGCGCAEVEKARQSPDFDKSILVLAEFNNIPLGPIVVRKGLDPAIIRAAKENLLMMHQRQPDAFSRFCQGWTEFIQATHFQPVADKDYDAFRQLFGNNVGLWALIE